MLLGIITCFGPALVISVVYGCMPSVSASMLAKADIAKEIIKYTEGIQGAIFASGRREYIVFSNSGAVQEEFNQRKLLNLQKKVQEEKKISLNVGIGTGGTMNDAEI